MRIYGLTGGIGSGKSEVSRRFVELGLPVIDADRIGHAVIAPGGTAERAVIAAFGNDIVTDGAVDRAKLAERVFSDDEARRRLNAIVHPPIGMAIAAQCAANADQGHGATIVEAALIAEDGKKEDYLSGLIVVVCPVAERVRRLMAYRGIDESEARRRIGAQTPPDWKVAIADWVIDNTGSIDDLRAQVDVIAEELSAHGH